MVKLKRKQERPPVWTQEAYRPPRSKYSLCCPILGGGVPHSWLGRYPIPGKGVSHLWPGWYPNLGYPFPILIWLGGTPYSGTPCPDLVGRGGTPSWEGTWDQSLGYPPERTWDQWKYYRMEMGYPPERTWDQWKYYRMEMGYPPERTWDQWKYYGMEMGYPLARTWDQWKYHGMEMGYTPTMWTDSHLWKQYLPIVLRTRAVIMVCWFQDIFDVPQRILCTFLWHNFTQKLGVTKKIWT